jgi:hypothetical protein
MSLVKQHASGLPLAGRTEHDRRMHYKTLLMGVVASLAVMISTMRAETVLRAADYSPTEVGLTLHYRDIDGYPGETPYILTEVITLTTITEENGAKLIVFEGSDSDGDEVSYLYRLGSEGWQSLSYSYADWVTEYTKPYIELPTTFKLGETFTFDWASQEEDGDSLFEQEGTVTMTFVGLETVRTPAGRFEDCLKVTITYSISDSDEEEYSGRSTAWYAKGLGRVLERWYEDDGYRGQSRLIRVESASN